MLAVFELLDDLLQLAVGGFEGARLGRLRPGAGIQLSGSMASTVLVSRPWCN